MFNVANPDYSCGADATSNTFTLINFLLEDAPLGEPITVEMDSIRNPEDYITPGNTKFIIKTNLGGDVDLGEWNSWDNGQKMFTPTYIKTFSV